MLIDSKRIDSGKTFNTDVCIIGGGAAGITIAKELTHSTLDVCLLESGGFNKDEPTQALSEGGFSGIPYFDLVETRPRLLGGSTWLWGGRSAPMQAIDFEKKDWVPFSGWPINAKTLEPFYRRAEKYIGLETSFHYDEKIWDLFNLQPPEFEKDKLGFTAFQFGKILLFGKYYKDEIDQAKNIKIFYHANVTDIQSDENVKQIKCVDVKTLSGNQFKIEAKCFILACGGIENARMLLLSNKINKKGLGNDNDLVGRFFMEHPTLSGGEVITGDQQKLVDFFSPGLYKKRLVETGLALSKKIQREKKCLNAVVSVRPILKEDSTAVLRRLMWEAKHRRLNKSHIGLLKQVAADPVGLLQNSIRHMQGKPKRYKIKSLYLEIRTEQAPNLNSRVTLSERKDQLGLRKLHFHWEMTEQDKYTMQTAAGVFEQEFKRLKLGKFRIADWLTKSDNYYAPEMTGGHHQMGTTRMTASQKEGVVDKNCKIHSLSNMYVAGSSVFSTAGFVNPTITILALAIRLADHLRDCFLSETKFLTTYKKNGR